MANDKNYKVIVSKCGSCDCGCPTVLEGDNPEELVIVGRLDSVVMANATVSQHTGDGETAIVIPRSLLLEAAKALRD